MVFGERANRSRKSGVRSITHLGHRAGVGVSRAQFWRWLAESLALVEITGIDNALIANSSPKPESPKTSANAVEIEGKIVAVLPGTMFRVQLANGHIVLGHISGKLRKHFIKIAAGDTVKMEMSPYDLEKARITYRVKDTSSTYRPAQRRRY